MTPLTQMARGVRAVGRDHHRAGSNGGPAGVTVGSFAAFITAMLMVISPIKGLSAVAGPVTRGIAALERGVA